MDRPRLSCHVLQRPDQVAEFWEWLTHRPRGYVACDIETGHVDPKGNALHWFDPGFRVRMVQFGDTEGGWAIPFQEWSGLTRGAFDWLNANRIDQIWHNGFSFDYKGLIQTGIKLDYSLLKDTFVYEGLLGYAGETRQLKPIAEGRLGSWAGLGSTALHQGMKNGGWNWNTVPMDWLPYPLYGVMDTCITALVYESMADERTPVIESLHDMEIATARLTNMMSLNGMRVDGPYLKEQIAKYRKRADELDEIIKQLGLNNPNSSAEIRAILSEAKVLDTDRMTPGGLISVDKKQLAGVDHPLARAVLEQRWVKRVADNYLDKIWAQAGYCEQTGVIHPSLWSMEARTHRMSASDPPVQQFPASDPTVRNAFIPREDGHVLISADYGQIEMRNWAALTRDEALLRTLNEADRTGEDFFVIMARQLFNEPGFQKSDKRRGPVKNTSYATIYGGGVNKIAETAGLPVADVQPIVMGLRKIYPSFADAGASMIEQLGDGKAQVTLKSGRQFRVREFREQYRLPNYCVQGDSAEKLKGALIGCGAAGLADYAVLAVHDELIFSVPRAEAQDASVVIKEIMDAQADPAELGVSITASPVIGDRWGALKD